MPNPATCTRFALHAGFDARQWSGVSVANSAGWTVTLPDYEDYVYADTRSFLNAHCGNGGSLTTVILGLGDDDKFYLFRSAGSFTLFSGSDNEIFGFSAAGQSSSSGTGPEGAGNYIYAPDDWQRGYVEVTDGLDTSSKSNIGRGCWDNPALAARYDSGSSVDWPEVNPLSTLLNDSANYTYFVGINDEGHCFIVAFHGASAAVWSWLDDDFRDRLGFSGDESWRVVVSSAFSILEADYPMPGVWQPTRPADLVTPITETFASAISLTDARMASNFTATHQRWGLDAYLDGPMDTKDDHLHWHRKCLIYLYKGAPCALYQDAGDTRLYNWRGVYNLEYTGQAAGPDTADPGYYGRIQGYIFSGTDSQTRTWPNQLKMRSPMERVVIQEYPFPEQWEA